MLGSAFARISVNRAACNRGAICSGVGPARAMALLPTLGVRACVGVSFTRRSALKRDSAGFRSAFVWLARRVVTLCRCVFCAGGTSTLVCKGSVRGALSCVGSWAFCVVYTSPPFLRFLAPSARAASFLITVLMETR